MATFYPVTMPARPLSASRGPVVSRRQQLARDTLRSLRAAGSDVPTVNSSSGLGGPSLSGSPIGPAGYGSPHGRGSSGGGVAPREDGGYSGHGFPGFPAYTGYSAGGGNGPASSAVRTGRDQVFAGTTDTHEPREGNTLVSPRAQPLPRQLTHVLSAAPAPLQSDAVWQRACAHEPTLYPVLPSVPMDPGAQAYTVAANVSGTSLAVSSSVGLPNVQPEVRPRAGSYAPLIVFAMLFLPPPPRPLV